MTSRQRQPADRWLGLVPVHVEMPTFAIPADCLCSWSVIRPGPGWNCISELRFVNTLCPARHERAARRETADG